MINKAGDERAASLKLRPLKKASKMILEVDNFTGTQGPDSDDLYIIRDYSIFERSNSENGEM